VSSPGDEPPHPPYQAPWGPPPYAAPPMPPSSRGGGRGLPGWAWPLMTAIALVVGLLGGILGGALVLGTSGDSDSFTLPALGESDEAVKPGPVAAGSVAAVARRVLPSTVQVRVSGAAEDDSANRAGAGSGFVIDRRGHVITNNHVTQVAEGGGDITVIDHEGRRHDAKLVGSSPAYDIAVLQIPAGVRLSPVELGSSDRMNVGDTVVAVGSPLGLDSTVTSGIVSALDRPVTTGDENSSSYISAVQTDAAINPGNSGGPLVDLKGRVIGVNSAIATTGGIFGGSGGNIGVGFAIPMEQVRLTATQILDKGHAEYPVIGASVRTGAEQAGALVMDVPEGTPADDAGLRKGDRIVGVDGKAVPDGESLIVSIRNHRPGERIELSVQRDGEKRTIDVVLGGKIG
jgi:putative serine protease PepD